MTAKEFMQQYERDKRGPQNATIDNNTREPLHDAKICDGNQLVSPRRRVRSGLFFWLAAAWRFAKTWRSGSTHSGAYWRMAKFGAKYITVALLFAASLPCAGSEFFGALAASRRRAFPTDGLVAYWSMDGNALDSVGNNEGSWTGTEAYVDGMNLQAANFDGASHIQFDTRVAEWTNDWNIAFWQYYDTDKGAFQNVAFSYGHGNVSPFYGFRYFAQRVSGAYDEHKFVARGTDNTTRTASLGKLASGWNHIAFSHNSIASNVTYYVNGVSNTTFTAVFGIHTQAACDKFELGAQRQGVADFFEGILDEVAVWNRALSSNEVSEIYNNGAGRFYTP